VDFGNPDVSNVQGNALNQNTSVTVGFNDDFFWSASLQAMSFGSGPNQSFAIDGAPYTIFDSGTSQILVPKLMFQPIIDQLIAATNNVANYAI
jgi:hypothetical protein